MVSSKTRRVPRKVGKASARTLKETSVPSPSTTEGSADRLGVLKTYKLYIGGQFPRTESGRYYPCQSAGGKTLANVCLGSRKDFREAVVAAREAQASWASKSAYNRGQILYRIAEMLEGRADQFVAELMQLGSKAAAARAEVAVAVDRLVYYAGWADKFQQVFSSVNPVASSHFNFSMLEPTGVVAMFAPEDSALAGLVAVVAPAICGGNTAIAIASHRLPLPAISFAEVLHTSDLPGGVVNIITGERSELLKPAASHMDVNAVVYCGSNLAEITALRTEAVGNLKRVTIHSRDAGGWLATDAQSPYMIRETMEVKTTWHPVGI